jgi:hypothetical protein
MVTKNLLIKVWQNPAIMVGEAGNAGAILSDRDVAGELAGSGVGRSTGHCRAKGFVTLAMRWLIGGGFQDSRNGNFGISDRRITRP